MVERRLSKKAAGIAFHSAGFALISNRIMTQDEGAKECLSLPVRNYRVASKEELFAVRSVIDEVDAKLKSRTSLIITRDRGLEVSGPGTILENGENYPMDDKWDRRTHTQKKGMGGSFLRMPISMRAWYYSGKGPVAVGYFDKEKRGYCITAHLPPDARGTIVLLPIPLSAYSENIADIEEKVRAYIGKPEGSIAELAKTLSGFRRT